MKQSLVLQHWDRDAADWSDTQSLPVDAQTAVSTRRAIMDLYADSATTCRKARVIERTEKQVVAFCNGVRVERKPLWNEWA